MRAYILVTGSIFGLLGLLHVARLFSGGGHAFSANPWFVWGDVAGITLCAGLVAWAWTVLRRRGSSSGTGT